MVHESHGLGLGKTGPVASGNEGDSKAVKACLDARFSEHGVDASIFVLGQKASYIRAASFEEFQSWLKRRVYRHGKILPWIILFTLGVSQPQSSGCQVDIFNRDRTLGKPAPGIEGDFEAHPHPFWLIAQFPPDGRNIGVGQFGLFFLRFPRHSEPGNRVGFSELTPDGFIDELREEFDLKESGVVPDLAAMHFGCHAPADIRPAVRVFDLARVNDALLVQEHLESLPSDSITLSGFAFTLPVGRQIAGHPRLERGRIVWSGDTLLLNGCFVGHSLSFSSGGGVIGAQAGGFIAPNASIRIALPNVPERGTRMSSEMSHGGSVCQSLPFVKWNTVEWRARGEGDYWAEVGLGFLPLHHEALQLPVFEELSDQSPSQSPKIGGFSVMSDSVNHPPHYTGHPSGVECIQITEHMGFCLGNAVKYIWRADLKGDAVEDLQKARWYLDRELQRRQAKGAA